MNYKIYELNFLTPLHIGSGKLTDWESTISADVLFSALCHEAVLLYGEEGVTDLVSMANSGAFRISDGFPCNDIYGYYLPKPMIDLGEKADGDSSVKKSFKKLKYIRWEKFADFCSGSLDAKAELELLKEMGRAEIRTMASIDEDGAAMPFSVGTFRFSDSWHLYFILAYETKDTMFFLEELLMSLKLSGIGGKRNAGLGKFELNTGKVPEDLERQLSVEGTDGTYASLSISMAEQEILPSIVNGAKYTLVRKSGFVSSQTYADTLLRKRDFFMFKAGSVFTKTFCGVVADVSSKGTHPVYRYGMPIFLEVQQ